MAKRTRGTAGEPVAAEPGLVTRDLQAEFPKEVEIDVLMALQEWTRERVPLDWAATQNNLCTVVRDNLERARVMLAQRALALVTGE